MQGSRALALVARTMTLHDATRGQGPYHVQEGLVVRRHFEVGTGTISGVGIIGSVLKKKEKKGVR